MSVADVPVLHAAMADVEVDELTGSVHHHAEAGQQSRRLSDPEEVYSRWAHADDRIVWAVVENASGQVVGESVLNDLDLDNRSFVHEGVKRQALRFEDEWVDAHIMSILAAEWAKHRGHPVVAAVPRDLHRTATCR